MKWDVHVYDPRSQTTKTHVMEYPGTSRAEAPAVTAYASRDLHKKMDHILAIPHHGTSEQAAPQPKKSHAQIKREVDEILASGPHRGSSGKSQQDSVHDDSGIHPLSFVAKIWSTDKRPLLGGLMRTESSPFSRPEDAESFLAQSLEINKDAGRAVTGEVVPSHKHPVLVRHPRTGELVARKTRKSQRSSPKLARATKKIAKDIESAVRAAQLYIGKGLTMRITDEQKLYRSMNRKISSVAKRRGMDEADTYRQIMEEAKRRGGLLPLPGRDI